MGRGQLGLGLEGLSTAVQLLVLQWESSSCLGAAGKSLVCLVVCARVLLS